MAEKSNHTFEKIFILILLGAILVGVIDKMTGHDPIPPSHTIYELGFRTPDEIKVCYNISNVTNKMSCLGFKEVGLE